MNQAAQPDMTKAVLRNVILSYPHLFELYKFRDEPDSKLDYSAEFIVTDTSDITELQNIAVPQAIANKWPQQSHDPNFVNMLDNCWKMVTKEGPYFGRYVTKKARGRGTPPVVVDAQNRFILMPGQPTPPGYSEDRRSPILPAHILPGSLVNVQVRAFGYDKPKLGIGLNLNMVQVLRLAGDGPDLPQLGRGADDPDDVFDAAPAGAPAPTAPVAPGPGGAPAASGPGATPSPVPGSLF